MLLVVSVMSEKDRAGTWEPGIEQYLDTATAVEADIHAEGVGGV